MWKTVEANREEAVMVPMITVIELCIKWFETEIIPGIVRVRTGEKVPNVEVIVSLELPRGHLIITICVLQVRVQLDLQGPDLVQLVNK